jgi:hypothetical protein
MPISIDWYGSPTQGNTTGVQVGNGGVLGMPRTDGLTDREDTIQGVRAYNSNAGVWTTADVDESDIRDPMSQKPFMWNDNNPTDYSDPTGYDAGAGVLTVTESTAAAAVCAALEPCGAIVSGIGGGIIIGGGIGAGVMILWNALPKDGGSAPKPQANAGPSAGSQGSGPQYTAHGKERVVNGSRGDGGVSDAATEEALDHGAVVQQSDGTTKHIGKDAVIITNSQGAIITGWATNDEGRRFKKDDKRTQPPKKN